MTDYIRRYAIDKINRKEFDCAKEYTLSMFSGKYKIVILYHLNHDGNMRFNQIQRLLEDASHKVITQQLNEMIDDGLVFRKENIINNRKAVFYGLTEVGRSLMKIVDEMFVWGEKRLKELSIEYKSI